MLRVRLSPEQIADHLQTVPGWADVGGKLSRTFEFPSYSRGVVFAVAVSNVAEQMDHHPDLTICYQRVTIAVNTHDVGGISPLDFELARRAETLL